MRSSRFSDEQIIGMIKEQEAGMPAAEVCRKHGISTASFYKYKAKFGGMEVSDGMHVRTYHRRLRTRGTSHRELLDQTRMALACRLLEYSSKDIAEISELLGYAESRSFIRAFKRWTATTPARWRRGQTI